MESDGRITKINQDLRVDKVLPSDDEKARFAALIERTQNRVLNLLVRRVFGMHIAEELRQETFLNAWRSREKFDTRRKEINWILEIASNVARDHFRARNAQKRGNPVSLTRIENGYCDHWKHAHLEPADQDPEPLERLIQSEEIEKLHEAIEKLEKNEKEMWCLHQADTSYVEIAATMDKTISSIGPALTRIRQKLKHVLEDYKQIDIWHTPNLREENKRDSA